MLIDFEQFGKQMIETPLLGQGADLIISAPEVADQYPLKEPPQNLFDHGRGSAWADQIIAELWGNEAPQPMGDAVEPPARFIGREDSAVGNLLSDLIVKGFQNPGQALPGLGQSPCRDRKAGENTERLEDVANTHAHQVMEPCGEDQEP